MPTAADATAADPKVRIALVDTSVAVALIVADHTFHDATVDALDDRRLGLAGHAAFETFSVLTRLPAPARRPPAVVAELLLDNFPETRHLSAEGANTLVRRLGDAGVGGGLGLRRAHRRHCGRARPRARHAGREGARHLPRGQRVDRVALHLINSRG
jgi:hypothetical protein